MKGCGIMTLGDNIRAIRKERKLTQEELAKNMGISRTYLSDIENSRKNPSSKTLESLSEKLNTSTIYLMNGIQQFKNYTDDEIKEKFKDN